MDVKKTTGSGMSGYIKRYIPKNAIIDFIFKEDFNGDGIQEAIVGFTEFSPFPPESSIHYFVQHQEEYRHIELLSTDSCNLQTFGIFDNAVAADTNGDGNPELVLSLAAGNGYYTSIFIFHWMDGDPQLAWRSEEAFYHGSVEVCDVDADGIQEIIVDSATQGGSEILALDEACYHVRESCYFKWNGQIYDRHPNQVRVPYLSYNTAVTFLERLWKRDYQSAYDMAVIPGFIGLDGLDDSSFKVFKRFVEKNIRPALQRNLSKGKLMPSEPYDAYCLFYGLENDFTVELVKDKGQMKVQKLIVHKKPQA